jgi:hypothetical protein
VCAHLGARSKSGARVIEPPHAALTAKDISKEARLFSATIDTTQTTLGQGA